MSNCKYLTEEERRVAKKESQRKWYAKNKEREQENSRKWYAKNKEYHNAYVRKKYQENRESILQKIKDKKLNETELEKKLRKERDDNYRNDPKNFISGTFYAIKSRRLQGKEVTITKKDLEELFEASNGICALSGLPLSLERNNLLRASVDRIDSSKGYVKGNLQFVAKCINIAKYDFTQEEFIAMCKAVVAFNS